MLADFPIDSSQHGMFSADLHMPATFLSELLNFIAHQLPRWRDDTQRRIVASETELTDQLCSFLNGAARHASGWDVLQFRTEVTDERNKGRKIDLVPRPCGTTIWIDERRHTQYDTLLPIECKRLPTPLDKDRDEREYIVSQHSSTGGIQRFKEGHHGASHSLGGMIAYVQSEEPTAWMSRISEWITALVSSGQSGWSASDGLELISDDAVAGVTVLRSAHERSADRPKIELRHLWIQMNPSIMPRRNSAR